MHSDRKRRVTSDSEVIEELRQQLVDLQSQLAFQEDTICALDAVVARQQQQLANLQEVWETQKSQLEQMSSQLDKGSVIERPPHY